MLSVKLKNNYHKYCMSGKQIILIILPLIGLTIFGYPLVRYWYVGLDALVIAATIIGLPMIGLYYQVQKVNEKRLVKMIKSGRRPRINLNLLQAFMFVVAIFVAVLIFNSLPVYFFMSFVYATMVGGFGWWFFRVWLSLKAADEQVPAASSKK